MWDHSQVPRDLSYRYLAPFPLYSWKSVKHEFTFRWHQLEKEMAMKKFQPVLSLTIALMMTLVVVFTAQAAPGGNDVSARLDQLEADMVELRSALDASNFTVVPVTQYVSPGATIGISANCPAGTTLRTWSYNLGGYVNAPVLISNDYPKPDLSGYFVRAHGGSSGGSVEIIAVCGEKIIE
jgi:hypothetical protein